MSVSGSTVFNTVGFAFSSSADETFGGFAQFLDQAQQECQGVAVGGLH